MAPATIDRRRIISSTVPISEEASSAKTKKLSSRFSICVFLSRSPVAGRNVARNWRRQRDAAAADGKMLQPPAALIAPRGRAQTSPATGAHARWLEYSPDRPGNAVRAGAGSALKINCEHCARVRAVSLFTVFAMPLCAIRTHYNHSVQRAIEIGTSANTR